MPGQARNTFSMKTIVKQTLYLSIDKKEPYRYFRQAYGL
jgi:hypothetical protein